MNVLERPRITSPARGELGPRVRPIGIVLAYHQAVVRSGLRMLLEGVGDFTVLATTADLQGARGCVRALAPDVLVLDLDQPECSAPAAILMLVEEFPATRLVLMSARTEPAFVRGAIAAGARGYVPSTATAGDLTLAIRHAASATCTLSAPPFASTTGPPPSSGPCDLSRRETEVLGLIALGHSNPEIAQRLALSVRTIETHRSHIRHKLDRLTRAELVEYAFAHGLEQPVRHYA